MWSGRRLRGLRRDRCLVIVSLFLCLATLLAVVNVLGYRTGLHPASRLYHVTSSGDDDTTSDPSSAKGRSDVDAASEVLRSSSSNGSAGVGHYTDYTGLSFSARDAAQEKRTTGDAFRRAPAHAARSSLPALTSLPSSAEPSLTSLRTFSSSVPSLVRSELRSMLINLTSSSSSSSPSSWFSARQQEPDLASWAEQQSPASVFGALAEAYLRVVAALPKQPGADQKPGAREACGPTGLAQTWLRGSERTLLRWFRPRVKGRALCSLLASTFALAAALAASNVTFFMYGGTLLGSWRHHGLVPWDDDVDLAVSYDLRQLAYRALRDLAPRYSLNVKQKTRWKFYRETDQQIPGVAWRYPFVDINFFHQNATHVWDHDIGRFPKYIYPREWVFPLIRRPFQGVALLPAPRETEMVLLLTYRPEDCQAGDYNHQTEQAASAQDRKRVTCDRLRPFLPFVQRRRRTASGHGRKQGGGRQLCNETLVQEGRVLGFFVPDAETC